MRTRRSNLLHFNDWMAECVKQLERSPHRTDQHLAVWFELQRITDEAMSSFGLDDTSATSPLTESRVQAVLRWFDKRMDTWRKSTPTDMLTGNVVHMVGCMGGTNLSSPVPMILEYRSAVLAMYDLGMGEGYRDPEAVKKRYFTLPTLEDDNSNSPGTELSAIRIDINVKWMSAAQELLDAALTCSAETMRKMPNIFYTRFITAVTSLLKIHFSVRTGALGEIVTPQTVNVSYYLDAMGSKLGEASGDGKYIIPTRWYNVVAIKGRDWLERLEKHCAGSVSGDAAPGVVPESRSIAAEPVPSWAPVQPGQQPHLTQLDPTTSSAGEPFSMPPGVSHMPPGIDSVRDRYVVMGGAGMWPMDNSHGQNQQFFQSMPAEYEPTHLQPAPIPPHFAYDPQQLPPQGGGQMPGMGTGMELDGWLPDGSIFGMPPLPQF